MRAKVKKKGLLDAGFSNVEDVELVDVYTIKPEFSPSDLQKIASRLSNPVTRDVTINQHQATEKFDWAIEFGYLPRVKDNVGDTAKEGIEDLLKKKYEGQIVASSQVMFIKGKLSKEETIAIAENESNRITQRTHIKSYDKFVKDNGMDVIFPEVKLNIEPTADIVDVLNVDNLELQRIGKLGIFDYNRELKAEEYSTLRLTYTKEKDELRLGDLFEEGGKYYQKVRRGPLALDLTYMNTIKDHFKKKNRNPFDIELESIAQTWSEHCKHTIFADPIDEIKDGLFRTYIKRATDRIRKEKGAKDFCISVFKDNSGIIEFDENYNITDKVETHNKPSALEPYGGAITGIVGVDRDGMAAGLGGKPFDHRFGFCFGDPRDKRPLYKGPNFTQKMLSPRRIMNGVINGVNVGGNCSGISTPQGFMLFDERNRGNPLVFVGVEAIIPKESAGRLSHEKKAQPGDYIVMAGGRVGKDGIHGATFSSEALDTGSPVGAVQIGDPITQKKMSDALIKEARDLGLYKSVTDNGAGGLSCSVGEMAKESNGCKVYLEKVPLKYPGLKHWEGWISESQERMTLAVSKEKWSQFSDLMKRRGVEATIIGEFTDSGRCVVDYNGKTVMDLELDFLHDGLPQRPMTTKYTKPIHEDPDIPKLEDLTESLHSMLGRLNIASIEFISQQYDHEVQGGSVIKPLQGKGRINGDASVTRPVLNSKKGVVMSQGINPTYSDIDTYHMAACAIDTAIRNAIATGANLNYLALLDNFCWCSSDEPERLGQLKMAAKACYDYAVVYGTPFISGKDSMFNDFKGYDENGNPIKISVPPTLLISSIGVMNDARKAASIDAKLPGDLVYVLGETHDELGASEYFAMVGEKERGEKYIGNKVPKVDAEKNKKLYSAYSKALDEGVIASAIGVGRGGLGVALSKTAMAGKLGLEASLENLPGTFSRDDFAFFSESQGRLVITIDPKNKERFEELLEGNMYKQIGVVKGDNSFVIKGNKGNNIVNTKIDSQLESYKGTFKGY